MLKVSAVPACDRKARPSDEVSRLLQELAWLVHSLCVGQEPSLKTWLERGRAPAHRDVTSVCI